MLVKKTKSGKFGFALDYIDRDEVASWLLNYLESESVSLPRIEKNPAKHLCYAVQMNLYHRYAYKLNSAHDKERFLLSRAEAICMLALLEGVVSITLKEVRSDLHKLLS